MNRQIMLDTGFEDFVSLVDQHKCPFCKKTVKGERSEFKNEISWKEFKISGLCQKCQDNFFKK